MWTKWITLDLGEDFRVAVLVGGVPTDTDTELRARAMRKLFRHIEPLSMVERPT